MNVLFINPAQQRCGVHQYGKRFYSLLQLSKSITADYLEVVSESFGNADEYDVVIYNLHPGINNLCLRAPYSIRGKQVAIFHEGAMNSAFDAWLVSDPSLSSSGNIHAIGRPLPELFPWRRVQPSNDQTTIGLSGFLGAWATDMVRLVAEQMPQCRIRLHLPYSDHMDPSGVMAQSSARQCHAIHSGPMEVSHDFMEEFQMLDWLCKNDLNCYIRPHTGSLGISSALDMALACRAPIAINKNPMFRYLTNCNPSICVEDLPLVQILENGTEPLKPHWERNDRFRVAEEVERILTGLLSR